MAGLIDNPLFQLTGLSDTKPMQQMSALSSAGSVPMGAPAQFSGYNKKPGDSIEMPNLSSPDVSGALDAGADRASRAVNRPSRGGASGMQSESDATDGSAGISPGLLNLARAMSPTSDDRSNSMAAAGIGMAQAGSHGSDFLTALSSGAGAGLDFFQKQRAYRAEQAMNVAKFQSEDSLRQAQSDQARAAAQNYNRESFNGNYPIVMMMAKRSGQPQRMMGPMGTPVMIMPDGTMQDGGAPQGGNQRPAPPGGPNAPPQGAPQPPPGASPGGPGVPSSAPSQQIVAPGAAGAPAPNMPSPSAPPPAAVDTKAPYVPQGFSKDAWDTVQMMSELPGAAGDSARGTIQKAQETDPVLASRRAGMVAHAEAVAKLPYETIDAVDPKGGYIVTMPKSEWMAKQAKAADTVNPDKAPGDVAAPGTQLPKLDTKTFGVQSVIPDVPDGGGFPVVPPGASKMTPMTEGMQKAAAETLSTWSQNSMHADEAKSRLRTLAQMYKLTTTNEWAEAKGDIANNLSALSQTLGVPFKPSKDFFGDPAAAQIAIKNATIAAFEQARQYTNRITNMELTGTTKSVAMPDLQPAATYDIITKGIADIDHGQAMQAGWKNAQKTGWQNPNAYEEAWYRANPPDAWVTSAQRRAGNFAGTPLPPPDELNSTATYVLKKGQMVKWNPDTKKFTPIKGRYGDMAIPPAPIQ